ncbi:MAG: asparaginase [Aeromicrobium sp.]|uniref:asparaginase n=1 Tax=Aeromicrobium sp. TaxID=1871063 RepID=UPI003C52F78A
MDVVAEVVRSGFVESRHRGVAVRVGPDARVLWSLGDPSTVVFPRSANKPIQALAMLRAGLPLDGELLALAAGSHAGESFHLAGVRAILTQAGLDESALRTPAAYPIDPHEHADLLRSGGTRAPILMDCSGKHAAMLLTCAVNGWPLDTYLHVDHPLQVLITETFTEVTGSSPAVVGTDGCGAPLLGCSLASLASAVGGMRRGEAGAEGDRLLEAWLSHPEYVSGTRRPERALMGAVPGLVAKWGAESVYVVGLPDGTAITLKIEDGAERPVYAVMNRIIELAGVQADFLAERPVVLGGGQPIGEIRTAF